MYSKSKIVVSGGFDPVHIGHIRLFQEAKKLGYLIVILNSDEFLIRKKGQPFMPFQERKKILESIKYIDKVVECIDKDQTVCKTLKKIKPDIFANGGDRTSSNIPEIEVCEKLGIKMIFGVGGQKIRSSSQFIKNAISFHNNTINSL